MVDLNTALALMTGAYNGVKKIFDVHRDLQNVEFLQQIVEAQSLVVEAQQEINNLRSRIAELEEQLKIKDSIGYDPHSGLSTIMTDGQQIPFCPRCHINHSKIVRLMKEQDYYRCPACGAGFEFNSRSPHEVPPQSVKGWL